MVITNLIKELASCVRCRILLYGVAIAIVLITKHNVAETGREDNLTCSQILFSRAANENRTNSTVPMDCTCKTRTQFLCPKLSSEPLRMEYNSAKKELTFSCNVGKPKLLFEVVIRHVGPYIKLTQPTTLHVSTCCSQKLSEASSHTKHVSTLHVNDIPSASTLRQLEVTNNCFVKVRGKFSSLFANLEELDLSNNLFGGFPGETFAALKRLDKLSLSKNQIRNLTRDTFKGLTKLRDLRLDSNQIETIPEDLFKHLINLWYLDFRSNKLQTLPGGLFRSNTEIRGVTFESNALKTLPGSVLAPLQKLMYFSAYNNQIEAIPSELFKGLPDLREVILNDNRLHHVPPDLLISNGFLSNLDLSWNNLREIPVLNLISSQNFPVASIRLMHNNISSIVLPLNSYVSTSVEEFDLSGNCIEHFTVPDKNNTNDYGYFIFNLICKRCCLRSINAHLLDGVTESVDLSDNLLKKVDMTVLKNIAPMNRVDLSNNYITKLDVKPEYPLLVRTNQTLSERLNTKIILHGNPITCDCTIMPFLNLLRHQFFPLLENSKPSNVTFDIEGVLCAQPPSLQIYTLWDFIRSARLAEELMCNEIANCPAKCHCYYKAVPAATVVNCSSLSFETFPRIDSLQTPIELHLENNSIQLLPCQNSSVWQRLSGLYLDSNRLKSIENLTVTPNLITLRLQDNLLTKFDASMQSLLSLAGITISLARNPWECSCELQKMKNAIVLAGSVEDYSQIKCTVPKSKHVIILANSTDYELCPLAWHNHTLLKALLSSAAAIVVAGSLLAVVFFRYKDQLYLWLFKKGFCLGMVTEEDIDYTKLFDAFVSCSNKDDQWVASHLLPGLEKGTPSYSLCIHSRNWPVGGWIPDQIVLSVQQSRRTIIILTENFLESHWSKLEFRTAYEQALAEPAVNRVLIVVPYEVPEVTDPVLSGFIKLNTYIKWGDPHFWRKLRCAMPRIKPNVGKKDTNRFYFTDKFVMLPSNVKSSGLSV